MDDELSTMNITREDIMGLADIQKRCSTVAMRAAVTGRNN
jgi:hypothetical protein